MRVEDLVAFMKERHAIYHRRQRRQPKPWTSDKILQQYRFCNVYRELDTVTMWIAEHWRKPLAKDENLFLALAIARFINWPETLSALGYPILTSERRFKEYMQHFAATIKRKQSMGHQVYSGAYMVRSDPGEKYEYLIGIFTKLWEDRGFIHAQLDGKARLASLHADLCSVRGVGSFMAGQIIADLKYVQLTKVADWWTFAASGPGSRRGLNRVCGVPINQAWKEYDWHETLLILYERVVGILAADPSFVGIGPKGAPCLHAQDLQNCLCEFDKYERVRLGEGRPRSLYPGA